MVLLQKWATSVAGALILYGLASYLPLAYIISWWQYEEAKAWESRSCSVSCGPESERGKYGSYGLRTSLSYRVEPRPTAGTESPVVLENDKASKDDLKPTTSSDEFPRKRKENLEQLEKTFSDRNDLREQDGKIREEDQKYMAFTHHNYRVFNLAGWNYWPNTGVNAFCSTYDTSTQNQPRFKSECFVKPEDPRQAALNRNFELGWVNRSLLALSLCALFGLVYSDVKAFRKKSKNSTLRG